MSYTIQEQKSGREPEDNWNQRRLSVFFSSGLVFHLLHDKKHECQHSLSTHLTASAIQNERRKMVFVPISKIPEKDTDWPGYGIRRSGSLMINVRKGRWFNKVFEKENGYIINIYMLHIEIVSINIHIHAQNQKYHILFVLKTHIKMLA